jgi:catechol 2,3-dioxygenase-like lactoylglutathione lyase family enzyme
MKNPDFVLLYVDSPEKSGAFYADVLGRQPVEASANFAMFVLDSGLKLGLWARHDVQPAVSAKAGGAELALTVDADRVDATHDDWKKRGITIAQQPTDMDFGRTFVGLDPDGHRLRVYAPAAR